MQTNALSLQISGLIQIGLDCVVSIIVLSIQMEIESFIIIGAL